MCGGVFSRSRVVVAFVALLVLGCRPPSAAAQGAVPGAAPGSAAVAGASLSGILVREGGSAAAGVRVELRRGDAVEATATTGADGRFRFDGVAYGTYGLAVVERGAGSGAQAILSSRTVQVAGDLDVTVRIETDKPASGLKTVARVSTSTTHLSISTRPSDVTVIGPSAFAQTGEQTWQRVLQQVPGVSFTDAFSGYRFGAESPLRAQVISIGGALPYETAVTVDGMPFVTTSIYGGAGQGTDVANLPTRAFDAIAIVRGPGADVGTANASVGGAVDFRTPGLELRSGVDLSVGNDAYLGVNASMRGRYANDRLSLQTTYDTENSPGPYGGATYGTPNNSRFLPATVDGKPFACNGSACQDVYGTFGNETINFAECCFPVTTASYVHAASVALGYRITPNITAQAFVSERNAFEAGNGTPNVLTFAPPAGYTGSLAAGTASYFRPVAYGDDYTRYGDQLSTLKLSARVGLGTFSAAALNARSMSIDVSNFSPQTLNLRLYGLGDVDGTPVVFNGETHVVTTYENLQSYTYYARSHAYTLRYDTPLGKTFDLAASFVHSAYVAPSNSTFYSQADGDTAPAYSQSYVASNAQNTNEGRIAVLARPGDRLSAQAALFVSRTNSHVADPADTAMSSYLDRATTNVSPRFGAVYRFGSTVSARFSAGSAFVPPPLTALVGTNSPPSPNSDNAPTYYVTNIQNVNLKPETSFGFSLGTDVLLDRTTKLSIDAYRTDLFGQFYASLTRTGDFMSLPLFLSQTVNIAQSRYEGVAASLTHDPARGFAYSVSGGLTRGYIVSVPAGFYDGPDGPNTANLAAVKNINFNGNGFLQGVAVPYSQAIATAGYRFAGGSYLRLRGQYFGSNNQYFQPAFGVLNVEGELRANRNVSFHATLSNLTGAYDANSGTLGDPAGFLNLPTVAGPPITQDIMRLPYGPRSLLLRMDYHV